jgi:hypothetical protein
MPYPICSYLLAVAAALLLGVPALAQTALAAAPVAVATLPGTNPVGKRPEPSIQRIRTEDAGSRIDEVRVGGETQSITVQPKANVPAYEVLPTDGGTAPSATGTGSSGKRVWNVLSF